jgi:hypothetical protein
MYKKGNGLLIWNKERRKKENVQERKWVIDME